MTLSEQFEKETGLDSAMYVNLNLPPVPTPEYVQWLEAKVQKPEVRMYSLTELEEAFNAGREYFVDDYWWGSFEDWLKEPNK